MIVEEEFKKGYNRRELEGILKALKQIIKWKRNIKSLYDRISNIYSDDFTIRETKLLRKLINQQKKEGYIDYQAIIYHFPGKTIEACKEKYLEKYDHLKRRGRKNHKGFLYQS